MVIFVRIFFSSPPDGASQMSAFLGKIDREPLFSGDDGGTTSSLDFGLSKEGWSLVSNNVTTRIYLKFERSVDI